MAAQKGGGMSERAILKTLIVCLLVGCFLVSNVSYVYASEASADSNENKVESSEEIMQPSREAQNFEEQPQPPEDTDTQSSKNDETQNEDVEPLEKEENQSFENTQSGSAEKTKTNSEGNPEPEPTEETKTNPQEEPELEPAEETEANSQEIKEAVSSENTETQPSEDMEIEIDDTGTQTSEETEISEDTESESSRSKGNSYHIVRSEYTKIENNNYIQSEPARKTAPENTKSTGNSKPAPPSASVSLHGEKTWVIAGEDILLKLSAVNLITKPAMHVQVIIIPPSGMSVSSSEFVQSGAGQYTTTYELEPGQGRDIEVRIETNQPGDFTVKGRVIYYFGEDTENVEDYTLDLPIHVEEKPYAVEESLPGFKLASLVCILVAVFFLKRRSLL
ncbi:MAG: hypothetical protein ACOX7X_00255 [Methanosarcina flavescens]|jgi:hypothetical protein|uniref:Uncharacterized protein n=1 Tax=Methanosarcina flavescens TaxID=1715806 RepID=A0A660HTX2_9EURY|nr:hypothetical protein [Methanosarcina flavescens]AYK15702.1 hypothetical protein AOB57_011330 [Methanosarcina flavescens]NLK31435.1 hypothetical protein [Methanosarcina flavescens]